MRDLSDGPMSGLSLDPTSLRLARERLAAAERVLVLTGAGISAESDVPTFRGEGGLWEGHRPEELATPAAFAADPARVWRWYAWRRALIAGCEPNPGHRALAAWLATRRGTALLVTQNVDGLHQAAAKDVGGEGPPAEVVPLHGDLFRVRCVACGKEWEDRTPGLGETDPPTCRDCGGLLRPAVVWFGESLSSSTVERAVAWALSCDAALVVGTSAVVYPAASLPLFVREPHASKPKPKYGHPSDPGCIVEVNVERTPLSSRADVHLPGPAGSVLPRLLSGDSDAA